MAKASTKTTISKDVVVGKKGRGGRPVGSKNKNMVKFELPDRFVDSFEYWGSEIRNEDTHKFSTNISLSIEEWIKLYAIPSMKRCSDKYEKLAATKDRKEKRSLLERTLIGLSEMEGGFDDDTFQMIMSRIESSDTKVKDA